MVFDDELGGIILRRSGTPVVSIGILAKVLSVSKSTAHRIMSNDKLDMIDGNILKLEIYVDPRSHYKYMAVSSVNAVADYYGRPHLEID